MTLLDRDGSEGVDLDEFHEWIVVGASRSETSQAKFAAKSLKNVWLNHCLECIVLYLEQETKNTAVANQKKVKLIFSNLPDAQRVLEMTKKENSTKTNTTNNNKSNTTTNTNNNGNNNGNNNDNEAVQSNVPKMYELFVTRPLGMQLLWLNNEKCFLIDSVESTGQAFDLKLKKGSKIKSINNIALKNEADSRQQLNRLKEKAKLVMVMQKDVGEPQEGDNENKTEETLPEFEIDISIGMDMAIDHPAEDKSQYPAVITKIKPNGQADLKGVEVGMHIHSINGRDCQNKKLEWVLNLVKQTKTKMKMKMFIEPPPQGKVNTKSEWSEHCEWSTAV